MVRGFGGTMETKKGKTHKDVADLRKRISAIRENFEKHPEINWRKLFEKKHPKITEWAWINVYYKNSTDIQMTEWLEQLWDEYKKKL